MAECNTYHSKGFIFHSKVIDGITHIQVESRDQSPEVDQIQLPNFVSQTENSEQNSSPTANSDAICSYLLQTFNPSKKIYFTQNIGNIYESLRKHYPEIISSTRDAFTLLPFVAFTETECSTFVNSSRAFKLFHESSKFKLLILTGINALKEKLVSVNGCESLVLLQHYENVLVKLLQQIITMCKPFPTAPNAINSIAIQVNFFEKTTYMRMIHFLLMVPDSTRFFSNVKELIYNLPYTLPNTIYYYYSRNEISLMLYVQLLYSLWWFLSQSDLTLSLEESLSTTFMDPFMKEILLHYDAIFPVLQDNKPYLLHILEVVLVTIQKDHVLMYNRNHSEK